MLASKVPSSLLVFCLGILAAVGLCQCAPNGDPPNPVYVPPTVGGKGDTPAQSALVVLGLGHRCLAATGVEAGAPIVMASCTQQESMWWTRTPEGSLKNVWSGMCLGTDKGTDENGAALALAVCDGSTNQTWRFLGDMLVSRRTDNGEWSKCADVWDMRMEPGAPVKLYDCWGGDNQSFYPRVWPDTNPATHRTYAVRNGACERFTHSPGCGGSHCKEQVDHYPWWLEVEVTFDETSGTLTDADIKGYSNLQTASAAPHAFLLKDGSAQFSGSLSSDGLTLSYSNTDYVTSGGMNRVIDSRCTLEGTFGGFGVDAWGQPISSALASCGVNHSSTAQPPATPAYRVAGGFAQAIDRKRPSGVKGACFHPDDAARAFYVGGSILGVYLRAGGPETLGQPLADMETRQLVRGGRLTTLSYQRFAHGLIYGFDGTFVLGDALPENEGFAPGQTSTDPVEIDSQFADCYYKTPYQKGTPTSLVEAIPGTISQKGQSFSTGSACVSGMYGIYYVPAPMWTLIQDTKFLRLGSPAGAVQRAERWLAFGSGIVHGEFWIQIFEEGKLYCLEDDCYLDRPGLDGFRVCQVLKDGASCWAC